MREAQHRLQRRIHCHMDLRWQRVQMQRVAACDCGTNVIGAARRKDLTYGVECNLFKFKLSHETSTISYTQPLAYA